MALRTPLSVTPHLYMGDSTGRPLDKGVVYFGEQDKDPEFYPINLFSDDALTKPLMQPVHTKGGYLYDKGDMVEPHAKELIYSVKVLDSYGRKVFYKGAMMRNSWNDDVIEQINTAIIGSADVARQVATDITNNAINNTAIEGGVLADTFVTMTKKAGEGTVARNLRDVNSETYSIKDFGAVGDGVADDTAAIQAAIDSERALLIPEGIFRVTSTIKTRTGTYLRGLGNNSVIKADNVTGPVILTYSGEGEGTARGQNIGTFCIIGKADCAVAFAHITQSYISDIQLKGIGRFKGQFAGEYGFTFEFFWNSMFERLNTDGAGITNSCFVLGRVVLDSIFTHFYTSNASDYCLVLDNSFGKYSTGTAGGSGNNTFNLMTCQGARKYGIKSITASNVTFNATYFEACRSCLYVIGGNNLAFNNASMSGVRSDTTHAVWIGKPEGSSNFSPTNITFDRCMFSVGDVVIGDVGAGIVFTYPSVMGNKSLFDRIKRTETTPSSMPLTVIEQGLSSTKMHLKTSGYAWRFATMEATSVDGMSGWKSNPITVPPLVTYGIYA